MLASIFFLIYSWYKNYLFFHNDLDKKTLDKIYEKEEEIKLLALKNLGINVDFPIIISEKLPSSLYGLASYSKNKNIKIYLNKNRFKESMDYMLNDVLPHEYAHGIIFFLEKDFSSNKGHSKAWQKICMQLEGSKCERFVNRDDIVYGKTNF